MEDKIKISCAENDVCCILRPHSRVLSLDLIFKLRKILKKFPKNKTIALNLQDVCYIGNEFLEFLKESAKIRKISIINLHAEIFALLNLTKYDGYANIFLSKADFIAQRRELLNRRFCLLEICD